MILTWFALFSCIFGVFASEHQKFLNHRETIDSKKVHPSLKIINGNTVSGAKYPFIASLQILQREVGAAVILNENFLLTTAFNVAWENIEDLQFRVGSNSYSSNGQVVQAAEVTVHPNYTGSWDYDIAVIKTDKPIIFNKRKVKAIQLSSEELEEGDKAFVAGWGMSKDQDVSPSDVLLEAKVTVMNWDDCNSIYNSSLTAQLMCTKDEGVTPCAYDFGDPLVAKKKLYGLYAGGYDCQHGDKPALYTSIPPLVSWINSVITAEQESNV